MKETWYSRRLSLKGILLTWLLVLLCCSGVVFLFAKCTQGLIYQPKRNPGHHQPSPPSAPLPNVPGSGNNP